MIAKKKHNSLHSIQKDKSSLLLSSNIDAAVVSGTWNSKGLMIVGEYNTFYVTETYIGESQKQSFSNSNIDCFANEPPATGKCHTATWSTCFEDLFFCTT